MSAKPNKSAASTHSFHSSTTTTINITPATTDSVVVATAAAAPTTARFDTNPANATKPVLSSIVPDPARFLYKEGPGSPSSKVMSANPDHRPNQSYQGGAPLRQVQQSPNLNTGQQNQQSFGVQGVFSPQTGIQSPYLNNPQQFQQHPQTHEGAYYPPNPSPRSTTSGAYYPSDKSDSMAAATATMQRLPYPQMYHTPQSNSPASVTSPQSHDHGRPIYSQPPPQMQQNMYQYPNYPPMAQVHQSSYGGHHQQPMNPQPMLPYQSGASALPQATMTSQPSVIASSPRIKPEPQNYAQTPQNQTNFNQHRYSTGAPDSKTALQPGQPPAPPATSNAAPGPIPATTPLVVRQDQNGVQWIAFEYSRDRVKMEYTIRCDVESVDANTLTQEFKGENCVYPRACVPKDQYKGNRLAYETDCNQVGWALAELNPCLRGKRGLIQRAVDSWRNSNQDPRLRSRRVRRQAKMNNRNKAGALTSQPPGPTSSTTPGLHGSTPMSLPSSRPPSKVPTSSHQGHHHSQHEISPTSQDSVGGTTYSTTPVMHRPVSNQQHITSPTDLRQAHTFPGYSPYPSAPTTMGPSMAPSIQGMHGYGRSGGNATMASKSTDESQDDNDLYGELPESKRRKFILVDDSQKSIRVRVKVTLDQIDTSEIPDSYRKQNSVFPRAYFPLQMQAAGESTSASRYVGDDIEEMDDGPPTIGRTTVSCPVASGEGEVEVSQLSRHRRDQDRKLNELGYRMAWGQSRVFANRPIFLGRALDSFRNKQRKALLAEGEEVSSIPAHLETRPGKRRWHERKRNATHDPTTSTPNYS